MNKVEFIWNDAYNIPKDWNEPVLALTKNKKLIVFKNTIGRMIGSVINGEPEYVEKSDWRNLQYKYKIEYWTYQKNLIV